MSLLNRGNEDVVVYVAEPWTDADGNQMWKVPAEGTPARAMIRPRQQSGTSARRAEQSDDGYLAEEVYTLRFARGHERELNPQSVVLWHGERWHVFGEPTRYNGSPRTRHLTYTIRRS